MTAPRKFTGSKLVIASHNPGKVAGDRTTCCGRWVSMWSAAAELGLPEPEETGTTFVANAELKARAAASAAGLPALADNSGLAVDALNGASRNLFGPLGRTEAATSAWPWSEVESELQASGDKERRAHFVAVLSLCWPDGHCEMLRGQGVGRLVWPPRGDRGLRL